MPLQRFRLYSQVLLAAHGVTGVRIMSWLPAFREIRRELAAGTLAGPRVVTSSRAIDGLNPRLTLPPPYGDAAAEAEEWRLVNLGNRPRPFQVGTPAEAREVIALATKAGVEVAKIHSGLTPELYFALADAAKTAGLYLAGHAPTGISIATLSDTGMRSIEHFQGMLEGCSAREDEILKDQLAAESLPAPERNRINAELRRMAVESFSAEKCRTLAVRLVKNGTWLSPTFTPEEGGRRAAAARSAEFARFVPAPLRARWEKTWAQASAAPEADPPSLQEQELARLVEERSREIVTIMRRAGVQFVIGTDAGGAFATPGPTLHEGLEETVKFGLTPMEAIEAATSSSARLLRMDEELGTIQTGKLADLVLLDANPLDQIANTRRINAVVMNGRPVRQEGAGRATGAARGGGNELRRSGVRRPLRRALHVQHIPVQHLDFPHVVQAVNGPENQPGPVPGRNPLVVKRNVAAYVVYGLAPDTPRLAASVLGADTIPARRQPIGRKH